MDLVECTFVVVVFVYMAKLVLSVSDYRAVPHLLQPSVNPQPVVQSAAAAARPIPVFPARWRLDVWIGPFFFQNLRRQKKLAGGTAV